MLLILLLIPPFCAAALAFLVRPYNRLVGLTGAIMSLLPFGATIIITNTVVVKESALTWGPNDVWRVDSLTALLLVFITSVATLSLILSPGLGRATQYDAGGLRRYHIFINLLIASMLTAVTTNNVAIMWIAVEATTIFSAMIIPLRLTKASVEASWKYILLGSVGISLAFAGTVLGYFDFVSSAGRAENALNWTTLLTAAPSLHPEVIKIAFVFLLIGFGTKAGIAPMHAWKPDVYGESPSTLGALMSSALLGVAIYALLRWKVITDAALGNNFTNHIFIALGLLSLAIGAFSLVRVRNYKRMLAYSSIEHTGLICLGLGLGPLGVFAALLHLTNHTAAKSFIFLLMRGIERRFGSQSIKDVRGLLRVMPVTAILFTIGILALIGLPPFGFFISELSLFRAGFAAGYYWVMGTTLVILAIAFVAIINQLNKMLYGKAPDKISQGEEDGWWWFIPLLIPLVALIVLGLTIPAPLKTLLQQTVRIVTNE